MGTYHAEKEARRLKKDLLRNPVLMIRDTPSVEDQAAIELVKKLVTPRVVRRPHTTTDEMVLPRLLAGQSSYDGLDDIRRLVTYLSRLTSRTPSTPRESA